MKFATIEHVKLFLLEIGKLGSVDALHEDFEPSAEMLELFIKSRRSVIPKLKNFRRSQASKEAWRQGRYKYMKGIKAFHRSTEGKRFHRSLGRFLATRETRKSLFAPKESVSATLFTEWAEALKALSSLKTHLFIELDYYRTVNEEVDLHILIEEVIPALDRVEKAIINVNPVNEDDLDMLVALVEPKALAKELADEYGVTESDVVSEFADFYDVEETGSYSKMLTKAHDRCVSLLSTK